MFVMNRIINLVNRCANKVVMHTDWYNNKMWGGASKFWHQNVFGLDVVNLGSGAGVHAFNYESVDIKGANWALGPQSLVHDFNILKNYFSFIREGGCVIITVCPFSGLFSQYGRDHNFKYYSFLHPATILNFEESERQKAFRYKLNPFKEIPMICIKETIKEQIRKLRKRPEVSMESSAKAIMNGWMKQFCIEDLSSSLSMQHQQEIEIRKKTLLEMSEFCKERSLNPIIVLPVMNYSLLRLFPKEFKYNYIDRLTRDVGIPVLDYMKDEMSDNDMYFANALMLNEIGAKYFTQKVIKDMADREQL